MGQCEKIFRGRPVEEFDFDAILDEAVKSQKPDGFEKSSRYGA
jgi:hypothetical protein